MRLLRHVCPFDMEKLTHLDVLNFRPKASAIRTTSSSTFCWLFPELLTRVMSSAYAVTLTWTPKTATPSLTFDFAARTRASAARLKTMALRASPCRTPAVGWMGIDVPLTRKLETFLV